MLKENWRLVSRLEKLGDILIIVLSFFIAYYGRDSLMLWDKHFGWNIPFGGTIQAPIKDNYLIIITALISYIGILQMLGAYSSMRMSSNLRILGISIFSSVLVFFILSTTVFVFKIHLSRALIVIFCILVTLFITVQRFITLRILKLWRKRGRNFRNLIICGIGTQAFKLAQKIVTRPELGMRIRAFADLRKSTPESREDLAELKKGLKEKIKPA